MIAWLRQVRDDGMLPLFLTLTIGPALVFLFVLWLLTRLDAQQDECQARGGVTYRSICLDPGALR